MSYRTILASIDESKGLPSILETALLLAQQNRAYLEGFHVRPAISAVVPGDGFAGGVPYQVESLEQENIERARRARDAFGAFRKERNLPWSQETAARDTVTVGWAEGAVPDNDIGLHGRLFDIIVVGRPSKESPVPSMSTLESALFESGRPILIAPPQSPKALGTRIVIAWNGSTESARAVAFAKPMLAAAEKVVVLTVEGAVVPGPSAAEVAAYLMRNGISAAAREVPADKRSSGEAILEESAALDADLLVKGAYTHSRLRQMIFGGATNHILTEAGLPVFMVH